MPWLTDLDGRLPKYKAVCKIISSAIASGHLCKGDKLPPRRTLARKLSVTMDTVARAFRELARQGLVVGRVGDGTYVGGSDGVAGQGLRVDLSQNHPGILYEDSLLAGTLRQLSRNPGQLRALLDYQEDTGHRPHQLAMARWLEARGLPAIAPAHLTMTLGGQHSLYLALRALLRQGDSLMAEKYSYPQIVTMAREMRFQTLPVPMDGEGLLPDDLGKIQASTDARVLYCQPTCHNPTTSTLGQERRRAIADLARRRNLLVIENITQAMYVERQPQTIFELAPENTVLIGSFSKLSSPGLRVGFIASRNSVLARISAWLRLNCWMPCLLSAEVVSRWIETGAMERLLAAKNLDLAERHELAGKHLRGYSFQSDRNSNYLWLSLPGPWEAQALTGALFREHLVIRGAEAFTIGRTPVPRAIRLSLGTSATLADLDRALGALTKVLESGPPRQAI
jgi:DNA-binding transcriptional MocR family regulator